LSGGRAPPISTVGEGNVDHSWRALNFEIISQNLDETQRDRNSALGELPKELLRIRRAE